MRNRLILAGVLGILLFFHLRFQPTQLAHYTDPLIYLAGAESIAKGQGYRFITHVGTPRIGCQPPLHAAYLSLFWKLNPSFPENMAWLYGAMFLAAAATFTLFFRFAIKNGVPPMVAGLLILAWGLSPQWASLLYGFMSDVLFGALMLGLACYWTNPKESHSARRWCVTGVLAALLYLTRTAASAVIAALTLVVLAQCWQRRTFRPLLSFLAPVTVTVIAWKLWTAGTPGYGDYIRFRIAEEGGWLPVFRYNFDSALDYLSGIGLVRCFLAPLMDLPSHPVVMGTWLSPVLTRVSMLFCWTFVGCWLIGWWRAESKVERVAGFVLLAYFAQLCLYPANLSERALFVVLPFTLVWAWKGLRLLAVWRSSFRWLHPALVGMIALAIAGNAFDFAHATRYLDRCSHREELAEVGAWLRANSPQDAVVAATLTEPTMHFYHYSGRRVVENYLAKTTTFSVAAHSTNNGARASYVLLDWYSYLKPEDLRASMHLEKASTKGNYRLYRLADQ